MQNIVLTGFMGTGKSVVGRLLAEETGRIFVDTDEVIIRQTGLTIPDIFERYGEYAFRRFERQLVLELANREELVIATGGGLMIDPLNVLRLHRNGIILCLTAQPSEIIERLANEGKDRPLLAVADRESRVRALLAGREVVYRQFTQLDTSGKSPAQVVREALQLVERMVVNEPWSKPVVSRLSVQYPGGHYDIVVGRQLLADLSDIAPVTGAVAILTDENVGPLYAQLLAPLDPVTTITIPSGERHKNLDTVRHIYERLLEAGLDRQGTLINLGGGVVGDVGGFVAATYLRGISVVHCPTTLLAMVDASIGGKTGVDLPQGKNLVGAFKQPEAVVADLATLVTLPPAELASGMAEVVKHGLIADSSFLPTLVNTYPSLRENTQVNGWQALLAEAIQVKQDVVEQDPYESGRRAILNLGHTFAHAIEQVSGYSVAHGPAVAIGLVAATYLSARLGHCSPQLIDQVETTLAACDLPIRLPSGLSPSELFQAMGHDKKRAGGKMRFVLIRRPGDIFVSSNVPAAAVRATWQALSS